MESLDGGFGRFLGFHGDEGEATRLAAEFIHDHIHFGHRAISGEEILKLVFGGVEGKISHKQFGAHDDYLSKLRLTALSQTVPDYRVSNHH